MNEIRQAWYIPDGGALSNGVYDRIEQGTGIFQRQIQVCHMEEDG